MTATPRQARDTTRKVVPGVCSARKCRLWSPVFGNQRADRDSHSEDTEEQRRRGGQWFRRLLKNVRPEHVGEMVHMLQRMQNGRKEIRAPDGRWILTMPLDYGLVGEGPVVIGFDPPPSLRTAPPTVVPKVSEADIERIRWLSRKAVNVDRPERDAILAQLYALDLDKCPPAAVEEVEDATWRLITSAPQ
jgi:hypothetical protein